MRQEQCLRLSAHGCMFCDARCDCMRTVCLISRIRVTVEELIQSRGNFCMMLSHPPRCLKGIPSSNKKHVGSLKYAGEDGVGGIIRKP